MIKILSTGLPVVGYVKIGVASEKSSRLKGAPMKFDHFEITGRQKDNEGRLIPDLEMMRHLVGHPQITTCGGCARSKELGFPDGLPTRLPIRLPYDSLELNFPNRLALYRGGTAFCVGDGATPEQVAAGEGEGAMRLKVLQEGSGQAPVFGEPEPFGPCGVACPDFQSRRCKPNARLQFVLETQQSVGGCYQFKTTSWNSIRNIISSLQTIQTLTVGTLNWIPLLFELSPQTVQPKSGGRANTAYVARVTHPGGPQQLLEAVKSALELRAPLIGQIRQLEASIQNRTVWRETPSEATDFEEEFYPETDDEIEISPSVEKSMLDDEDLARLSEIAEKRAHALRSEIAFEGMTGGEVLYAYLADQGISGVSAITKTDLPELLMGLTRYQPPDPNVSSGGGQTQPKQRPKQQAPAERDQEDLDLFNGG